MGTLYNIFRKKDHIVYLKGVLSQEDCKTAIDYFEEHKELQYAGRLNGKLKPKLKSDTEICFTIEKDKSPCPVLNPVFKALNGGVDQYKKEYPYIDKLPNVWILYNDIKIQPQFTSNFIISSNHFYVFILKLFYFFYNYLVLHTS